MKLDFQTDGGIGTSANLGVIVLETDETLEHEFRQIITGEGIALYVSRISMVADVRPDTLAQMEADLPASAKLLPPSLTFDAVGFGCTSASTVIGSRQVGLSVASGCSTGNVTDPLAAIIAAGRALKVKRIGFLTPYVAEISAQMRSRLEKSGFEIASFGSFEEGQDPVVARISPASILAGIEAVAAKASCDAVVVSCTNLRCLDIITEAEAKIGVPVISSNQALAWHMMRLADIPSKYTHFGRLLM